jgi:hypothetical protein
MLEDIAILAADATKIDQDTFMEAAKIFGDEYAKELATFWAN